jgi:hypothetical protein
MEAQLLKLDGVGSQYIDLEQNNFTGLFVSKTEVVFGEEAGAVLNVIDYEDALLFASVLWKSSSGNTAEFKFTI